MHIWPIKQLRDITRFHQGKYNVLKVHSLLWRDYIQQSMNDMVNEWLLPYLFSFSYVSFPINIYHYTEVFTHWSLG
jgi:hypothetical protein